MTFTLSPQQQAVVQWATDKDGNLILIARAGCGKTFTIIQTVRAITDADMSARILICAFNKSIADEVKAKVEEYALPFPEVQAATLHSVGFSAIRKTFRRVKVDNKKVGQIFFNYLDNLPEDRQEAIRGYLRFFLRAVSLAKQHAFSVLHEIDDADDWMELIDHFGLEDSFPEGNALSMHQCVRLCIRFYQQSLVQCEHTIDFDDMILAPLYYNMRLPKKDWVFIDEAQDTNSSRRELAVRMLRSNTGRLVAVGDDRQAIYGFTGADSDALEIIRKQMNAETLPLTVTYRCAKAIIAEAQKYVPDIEAHPSAKEGIVRDLSFDEFMQGEFRNLTPDDVILCRLNRPFVSLAYQFIKAGKGCYIEGRDIGKGLVDLARKWKRIKTVPQLVDRLGEYVEAETAKWKARGRPEMIQSIEDKVDCLQIICEQVPNGSIDDLKIEIEKLFGDTRPGKRPRVVTLSSIHKSKGREWDRVYAYGFHELIPSPYAVKDWQLNQEQNLAYVCDTRAKMELVYLSLAEKES